MTVGNPYECSDALVCIVIGSWKSNMVGSEDGQWRLVHFDPVCKESHHSIRL